MKLSKEDANLFWELMWRLQFYVNRRLGILPKVGSPGALAALPVQKKLKVRDALWKHSTLIADYVRENPDSLPPEHLDIVRKWEKFIAGNFFIVRFLKSYAVFLSNDKVYGVLALHSDWEEVVPGISPPVAAEAVLLPFRGKIVYDGMLQFYRVVLGGGMRQAINEAYMAAKQKSGIITSLEESPAVQAPKRKRALGKDTAATIDEIAATCERLRGGNAIQSATLTLLRASAALAQAAAQNPDDPDRLGGPMSKVVQAIKRVSRALERAEE